MYRSGGTEGALILPQYMKAFQIHGACFGLFGPQGLVLRTGKEVGNTLCFQLYVAVLLSASPLPCVFASGPLSFCCFGSFRASVLGSGVDFASVQLAVALCSVPLTLKV